MSSVGETVLKNNEINVCDKNGNVKNDNFHDDELTCEDLAPDGGWGWMVALGFVITFSAMMAGMQCSAIIFKDLYEATGQPGSASSIITSTIIFSSSLAGLFLKILLQKFSMRTIGIIGSLMYILSWLACVLATNIYQLAAIVLVLGFGIGIMLNIVNTNFNCYFVKRRATVMAAAQIFISLFCTAFPIFIGKMTEIYGTQGSLLIFAGLSTNTILAMLLMHPVEWHLKDRNEVLAERSKINGTLPQQYDTEVKLKITNNLTRWSSAGNVDKGADHHVPLLNGTLKEKLTSTPNIHKELKNKSVNSVQSRCTSISSLANLGIPVEIPYQQKEFTEKKIMSEDDGEASGMKKILDGLLDISLLKDRVFMITCFGMSFALLSDIVFLIQLPIALYDQGYTGAEAGNVLAVASSAEFVTKIGYTILTMFVDIRAKVLVFIAMISMALVKLAFYFCSDVLIGLLVTIGMTGVVRVFIMVPMPLVVVEGYTPDKYSGCFGIYSMVHGCTLIAANLTFGVIKDYVGFDICQIILIILNCVFIIPWGMDLTGYYKNKRKNEVETKKLKTDCASRC